MALTETPNGLWFQEDLYADIACGFRVSAILHHETSAFQDSLILDAPALGMVLVVGGDGGIARECLKHADVAHVTVVDIDPRVRGTMLAHFPDLPGDAYTDARLTTVDADAVAFVRGQRGNFDLIVADIRTNTCQALSSAV